MAAVTGVEQLRARRDRLAGELRATQRALILAEARAGGPLDDVDGGPAAILRAVYAEPDRLWLTADVIAAAPGFHRQTLRVALYRLLDDRLIEHTDPYHWRACRDGA